MNGAFFVLYSEALPAVPSPSLPPTPTPPQLKGGSLLNEPGKLPEQAGLFAPTPLRFGTPGGMSKKDKVLHQGALSP